MFTPRSLVPASLSLAWRRHFFGGGGGGGGSGSGGGDLATVSWLVSHEAS